MSRHLRLFAVLVPSALAASGCGMILGIDDFTDGPGTTSQGGGGSGGATTTTEGGGGAGGTTTTQGGGGAGGATTTSTEGGGGAGGTTTSTGICGPGEKEACYEGPEGTEGVGICKGGARVCNPDGMGWGECEGQVLPGPAELCSTPGDDDCNGLTNEGQRCCTPNQTMECYTGPAGTKGVGQCKAGSVTCPPDGNIPFDCPAQVLPADEYCSTPDDEDCNGKNCWVWSQAKGGFSIEYASAVATDPFLKRVVVAGTFDTFIDFGGGIVQPFMNNKKDAFLAAYDSTGAPLWARAVGKDAEEAILDVVWDSNGVIFAGGYYLFGETDLGSGSLGPAAGIDAFVGAFGADGQNLWSRKISGSSTEFVHAVRRTTNGYVFAGDFTSASITISGGAAGDMTVVNSSAGGGSSDIIVAQYTTSGSLAWATKIGGTSGDSTTGTGGTIDADFVSGNVYLVGQTNGALTIGGATLPSGSNLFLTSIASSGAPVWSKGYTVQGHSFHVATNFQGVYLGGTLTGTGVIGNTVVPAGGHDIVVASHDAFGTVMWTKVFGGSGDEALVSMQADVNGAVITGTYSSPFSLGGVMLPPASPPGGGSFIARLTHEGDVLWVHPLGAVVSDIALDGSGYTLFAGGFSETANFGGGAIAPVGAVDIFFGKLGK